MCSKLRLHDLVQVESVGVIVFFVLFCFFVPSVHAASHVDHEKIIAWFFNSVHARGSVAVVMVLRLATFRCTLPRR